MQRTAQILRRGGRSTQTRERHSRSILHAARPIPPVSATGERSLLLDCAPAIYHYTSPVVADSNQRDLFH